MVRRMTWKSSLGLTLALFIGSLAIVPVFAPIQQKRTGFLFGVPDYSLLNATEINRRTLQLAATIKGTQGN